MFLQCGTLKIEPYQEIYKRAMKWIGENFDEQKKERKMVPAYRFDQYFPEVLKSEDAEYVQVIVIPQTGMSSLL